MKKEYISDSEVVDAIKVLQAYCNENQFCEECRLSRCCEVGATINEIEL